MLTPVDDQEDQAADCERVEGFKFLKLLNNVLHKLHDVATERDRAGNRELHFDQYVSLLLLYFFSPSLTSLRAIQRASELEKVQKITAGKRVSLGSLSEAQRVFDPSLLRNILGDLASQAASLSHGKEAEALKGLTAVDGSLLPALPRMAWALWQDDQHRAAKLHLHFDVFQALPVEATLTEGNGSERHELRSTLQKGRLYVLDRGYLGYEFFQEIIDAEASFICRVKDHAAYRVIEQRPISEQAAEAGVIEDVIVDKLGSDHHKNPLQQPVRIVKVQTQDVRNNGEPVVLVLVTDRLDLDADLVA
ncbi:MAG: IS4 family transposase, partial [Pseudomonadales bacterium]